MSKYSSGLRPEFAEQFRDKTPPWGPVGYIVYKRTYSRMRDDGVKEEWFQTLERVCNGLIQIGGVFTQDELEQLYGYMFNLKALPSGRALWQLGTKTVERLGADSLQNCWHVAINHPVDPFCFTFNQLMLGGGVGFNMMPEYVYELPTVKYGVTVSRVESADCSFIVPDIREGWVELLRRVLGCFFFTGQNLTYSTQCIRHKGRPISSFGGVASGPEILVYGVDQIARILRSRVNNKLRPIDCLDIMNIIGEIVVAGNVRRSAELALGGCQDLEFLRAKDWTRFQIPNWRGKSNNSVAPADIRELPEEFWEGYTGNGEAYGFVNLNLCRSMGRLLDGPDYRPDGLVTGTNPCGEITLEPYEACNLAEIFLPNIHSREEFFTAAALMYKCCKTISRYPFSEKVVNDVVNRNHRLGISVSGILQSQWSNDSDTLSEVYDSLEELDEDYSDLLRVSKSIKLTTVKPSGTLSLLPGVTPGVHPAYARHYVRRIRFSANDPLVDTCRQGGYPIEPLKNYDGSVDLNTMVVSFPVKTPPNTVVASQVSVFDQMDFQRYMQTYWSDNSVSVTCYYKPEEVPELRKKLEADYAEGIKSISFLLHSGHGFLQAPLEEIDEVKYNQLSADTRPVLGLVETEEHELTDSLECAGGSCPIK